MSRQSRLAQILFYKRNLEAVDRASAMLKQAFDALQVHTYLNIHSMSETVLRSLEQSASINALDAHVAALKPADIHPPRSSAPTAPFTSQRFFCRDYETAAVVEVVLRETGGNVALLGGPGMGKTSVALAALHAHATEIRFRERRYFVQCDAIDGDTGLLATICATIGIAASGRTTSRADLVQSFGTRPSLLVLDNFETVWESPLQRAVTEDLLTTLADIRGLSLIITLRGSERPGGVAWSQPMLPPLTPLTDAAARQIFAAIADIDESDAYIPRLISELDNIPLAVTLLAYQAQYEPSGALFARWTQYKTASLTRGLGEHPLDNLDTSIGMSLRSPRMAATTHAVTILSLLSVLPLGAARSDFAVWSSHLPDAERALSTLLQTSLAYRTIDDRVCVLSPIREFTLTHHPPPADVVRPLYAYYFSRAGVDDLAAKYIYPSPDVLVAASRELDNLDHLIRFALQGEEDIPAAIEAAAWAVELFYRSGLGSCDLLLVALKAARSLRLQDLTARLLLSLAGFVDRGILTGEAPKEIIEEALALYTLSNNPDGRIDAMLALSHFLSPSEAIDVSTEARSIALESQALALLPLAHQTLAEAHTRAGNVDAARTAYETAVAAARSSHPQSLFVLSECSYHAALLSLRESDVAACIAALEELIPVLDEVYNLPLLGIAHIWLSMLLVDQGYRPKALSHAEAALPSLRAIGADFQEMLLWRWIADIHLLGCNEHGGITATEMVVQCAQAHSRGPTWTSGMIEVCRAKGNLFLWKRDLTAARTALWAAVTRTYDDKTEPRTGWHLHTRAQTLRKLGEVEREADQQDDALTCFITAAILYRQESKCLDALLTLTLLSEVLPDDAAIVVLAAILLPLLHCGYHRYRAHALRVSAKIAYHQGDLKLALHRAQVSLELYDSMDFPREREKTAAFLHRLRVASDSLGAS